MDLSSIIKQSKEKVLEKKRAFQNQRFIRRSELDKDGSLDQETSEKKLKIDDSLSKNLKKNQKNYKDNNTIDVEEELIPIKEIITRLRKLSQPIRFFGETHRQTQQRMRQIELIHYEEERDHDHDEKAEPTSFQNLMDEVQQDIEKAQAALDEDNSINLVNKKQTEDIINIETVVLPQTEFSKYEKHLKRSEFETPEDYILFFLKRLLSEWERELEKRNDREKRSTQGKIASVTQKQTRQYLKPLFKQLKQRTVHSDILSACEEMVSFCEKREYVRANKTYLTMSIGNALWPVGVTAVGIHERSGREKISNKKIAHILNDDTTRKFIQSIKRLITYCQNKYPNSDYSKNIG